MKKINTNQISPSEWYKINNFVHDLSIIKNRCVSVYYPRGSGAEMVNLLQKTKRDDIAERIELAIEKRIVKLQKEPKFGSNVINTLCVFGWITNGKVILKHVTVSKKLPYIYILGKKPYLKPFKDILKVDYKVILAILDNKSAKLTMLQGNKILDESKISIHLMGRHRKGGQSQGRFLRARQTKIHIFFKKVAKKVLEMDSSDVKILFLGGNGLAKTEFHDELDPRLMKKCRFIYTVSFSTPAADIHKKLISQLYTYRKKRVSGMLEQFEQKVKEGKTARKNSIIKKALTVGAVGTLFVSARYHSNPKHVEIMKMLEMAENTSAKIEFVTAPNLVKKLEINDSVLAVLRYRFK
ncbi:MAG: Peptide chain release factor subunit 1 protein [Cenarchaeum symbiont of Oopsacas minuta]|nr:Peptide chain release factor subunit 1 protein [Cenarchaeum symbiont of Oopsacas minuta]